MTTQDYRKKSPLMIFLSYFKNHRKIFAVDVLCAMGIAGIDLMFPLVTRSALYEMLPNQMYRTFFIVMAVVVCCYLLRSCLNFIVAYYGHTFGIRVEADIRRDLFRHIANRGGFHNDILPGCKRRLNAKPSLTSRRQYGRRGFKRNSGQPILPASLHHSPFRSMKVGR